MQTTNLIKSQNKKLSSIGESLFFAYFLELTRSSLRLVIDADLAMIYTKNEPITNNDVQTVVIICLTVTMIILHN